MAGNELRLLFVKRGICDKEGRHEGIVGVVGVNQFTLLG